MMFRYGCLIVFLLAGCGTSSSSVSPMPFLVAQDIPAWIAAPPEQAVSACARIKEHDNITAKKLAIAKAQADCLTKKSVTITAKTDISEQVNSNNIGITTDTSFTQHINLQSQGEVTYELHVLEEQIVRNDKYDKWCVLMGTSK